MNTAHKIASWAIAYAAKHAKVFRLDERPAVWPPPAEPRALTPYDVEVIAMLEKGAGKN